MDSKEEFFQTPIDRTPYGSCGWLAFFIAAIFIGGFALLWTLAGAVKSIRLPHISLPHTSQENVVDQVKKTLATPSASPSPTPSLQEKAEQAIQDEANKQIQNHINQVKDQYLPQ